MRKIFGIGETILDIIFVNDQPTAAVPGGSTFNAIISLGRAGVQSTFISETGDDRVGRQILKFMEDNGVSAEYMAVRQGGKSPIALAFLNERYDAEYLFYKENSTDDLEFTYPDVRKNDLVLFGSYYAINPMIRKRVDGFLRYAKSCGAILYYDVNFRDSYIDQLPHLMPTILDNFSLSTIVRGSTEDFNILFGSHDTAEIYTKYVAPYCTNFICTHGSRPIELFTSQLRAEFPIKAVDVVSTIGAGDNFNAGLLYGLLKYGIDKQDINQLDSIGWESVVSTGQLFSANVCQSLFNYIDTELGKSLQ